MLKKMILQGMAATVVIAVLSAGYALMRAPTVSSGLTQMASALTEGDD
ncbi:hypothetical protein [Novispirillum itersonii]|uniref:Uncharacterized protein n=1 Tax=Novispirillum itersonii TaxID=189 RepID=A0A7X0DPA6_NOVIT|nr:hypothetical protein [Novispirillum itersonii]MBB6211052.1 hypothetical protein [Novispirillum itersonii]